MSFSINLGNWNSIFAVPTSVVDKHIKLAGSAQLKVLLWILRHAGENFTIEDLADSLSMHKADAKDAMQYWIETGIIINKYNELCPSEFQEPVKENINKEDKLENSKVNKVELKKSKRAPSRPQQPDPSYVAKRISESEDISYLMQEAQVILGRMISNADCATLLMIHDNDGLPIDVILMLLQYAISIGKKNMKYIEKVAISWSEEEIDNLEKAEKKIRDLNLRNSAWRKIETIMGIDHRSPTAKEAEMSNRWINEWKYKDEMIREAYERCVDAKGKYIASYIDSIIKRWYKNSITRIEQAIEEKAQSSNKQSYSKEQNTPSYDIEEYENYSIFDDETEKDN